MLSEDWLRQFILEQKEAYSKRGKTEPKDEVYCLSKKQYERIVVHAEDGRYPEELFEERAPNQTDVEKKYLRKNYKTITLPVWERFLSVLSRIWSDQNWSISYQDNDHKVYLEEEYPVYGSLESYFKDVITTMKELDNNGVIALRFYESEKAEDITTLQVSERELLNPIVKYFKYDRIAAFKEGQYCAVVTDINSKVSFNNKIVEEGLVIDIYDENTIYRAYQIGKKVDYDFEVVTYYTHNLGYLPVKKLNGKAVQVDSDVFYKSAFISAVPSLDQALLDDSYLTASKAKCAFPRGWEYTSECDFKNEEGNSCVNGIIRTIDGDKVCPSCHGTGIKRPSILGVHQIKIPENGTQLPIPAGAPFGFVEPGITTLEFLRKEIQNAISNAASILNIDLSNSDVKGSETALGKQIDREELFAFIKRISDQLFELFEFSVNTIILVRYGDNAQLPTVMYPRTFSIRSDSDITDEISEAKTAGLPNIVIKRLVEEWGNVRFSDNADNSKIIEIIYYTDRLWGMSPEDILKAKAVNAVASWEIILHDSMDYFIKKAMESDANFLSKSLEEQSNVLVLMAKAKADEIAPKAVNVDTILSNANA